MRIILCGAPDFANSHAMEQPNQALEDARRAGIDLDLLDSNLALTYEQRWQRHDEALGKVRAYEKSAGVRLPEGAIIRRGKSGVELLLKVNDGYEVQRIG